MKVLVAIEDKSDAATILETIRNREWPGNTHFVLVHVLPDDIVLWDSSLLDSTMEAREYAARCAYRLLVRTARQLKTFMPDALVETVVYYGAPPVEVSAAISETQPEVVIVGKHSRTRLEKLLRKSISDAILSAIPPQVEAVHVVQIPDEYRLGHRTGREIMPREVGVTLSEL